MPITKEEDKLAQETFMMLQENIANIKQPVRITPKRMLAFQNAIKMRTTLTINGVAVQLVEDRNAPTLENAIKEACPQLARATVELKTGAPCRTCNGTTVRRLEGSYRCLDCGDVATGSGLPSDAPVNGAPAYPIKDAVDSEIETDNRPRVVLASERNRQGN